MNKLSVIILNLDGLNYLKQTIPAILRLSYSNIEVIVFDNASTDGSIEFLENFQEIKLIKSSENLGYSKGKNQAVSHATGDFILMLDNDILINDVDILEQLIKNYSSKTAFLQLPLVDVGKTKTAYYGIYYSLYGVNLHKPEIEIEKIQNTKQNLIEIGAATGGCMFFERKKWDDIGGFDENQSFNLDDMDIGPRAVIYGYKNFLYTKSYFTHLGIVHKQSSRLYANRFKLVFSGHTRSMFKNYKAHNLMIRFPLFVLHQLFKAIKYSVLRKNGLIFLAFCNSFFRFCGNFKSTLRERKIIQRKRKIETDDFLKIKIPEF